MDGPGTKLLLRAATAVLSLQLVTACSAEIATDEDVAKQTQAFILLPSSNLMQHVKKSSINVCIAGDEVNWSNKDRHVIEVSDAIRPWLDAITQVAPVPILRASNIQFRIGDAAGSCDITTQLKVRFWLNANPAFPGVPAMSGADRLEVWPGGDNSHVLLHEIGHHFGLDDTYDGAGGCKPMQPDSVMCEMSRSTTLMADDIAGVHAAYCSEYPHDC